MNGRPNNAPRESHDALSPRALEDVSAAWERSRRAPTARARRVARRELNRLSVERGLSAIEVGVVLKDPDDRRSSTTARAASGCGMRWQGRGGAASAPSAGAAQVTTHEDR